MDRTAEDYAKTVQELQAERAAVLGRLGRALEATLLELSRLTEALAALPAGTRARRRSLYEPLLEDARRCRWYLEVQREAVGIRDHRLLDVHYPLPRSLPLETFEQDKR